MRFIKRRTLLAAILMISLFALSSCTKKNDSTSNKDDNAKNETAVSDSNFNETNEDLKNVDYKQFYDELAPHGDWVQVSAKDLGIDLKKEESAGESSILNDLIGIKDAYADDVDFGMFFVWRPSPELAVSVSVGEPPVYVPYTRGQWIYTDDGWYFRAPTPYEEITCHYGRWAYSPAVGWVWVPGRVWAPAWVEWRDDDDYIGWAPLPPCSYIVDDGVPPVFIDDDRYIFVDRDRFVDPDIYTHCYPYRYYHEKIHIKEMRRFDGVIVKDRRVFERGPEIDRIEKITGRKIEPVKINRVDNIRNVKYAGGELNSYSPHFTKVKGNDRKESVTKPNNFISYDHAESKHKNEITQKNAGSNDNKALRNNDSKVNNGNFKGNNKQNNEQVNKGNSKNNFKQRDNNNSNNNQKFRRKSNDNKGGQKQYKGNDNRGSRKQYKGNNNNGSRKQYNGNDNKSSKQKQFRKNSNDNNGNQQQKQDRRNKRRQGYNDKPIQKTGNRSGDYSHNRGNNNGSKKNKQ